MLDALHVPDAQAVEAIEKLQSESKRLAREVTQLKTKIAVGGTGAGATVDGGDDTTEVAGVTLARRKVSDMDKEALRGLADDAAIKRAAWSSSCRPATARSRSSFR